MVAEEVFKDMGEGEADDWHCYSLCRGLDGGTRQHNVDTPGVSQKDCIVCAVGILPLKRFGYQSGEAEGGREFPVFKIVEDLGDDFHRKIWGCLETKVGTKGFWRRRGRCICDGRWLRAILT